MRFGFGGLKRTLSGEFNLDSYRSVITNGPVVREIRIEFHNSSQKLLIGQGSDTRYTIGCYLMKISNIYLKDFFSMVDI
jgi:hypothetical protein